MAYLGSWKLDDYVPIPVTTHKFSTGAALAPTSLTYSIYEDGSTTGIAEDVDMTPASPHDGVVGFYLARPQLTAAAGFEKGKNYTVLIKATVDSVAAITAHTFQIEAEVDANVVSGTVATVTNLTNAPTGMALEATLTAMKGAGWTDETLVAIKAALDAIDLSGVAAAVWAAAVRTLTQSAASVIATVTGSDITCQRGDSLSASLTDVGALTGYSKVYFTVKRDYADADTASIIQIEKTAGLKYLNGAVGTPANGSLTIDDEATGDITIALDEVETAKLDPGAYSYDVQVVRTAGSVSTLTAGTFEVAADVTRATA